MSQGHKYVGESHRIFLWYKGDFIFGVAVSTPFGSLATS